MKIFKIGKFDFIKYGGIEKVCEDLINELKNLSSKYDLIKFNEKFINKIIL